MRIFASVRPHAVNLYKYRDFSNPCEADFQRLETLLRAQAFWCARPDTLNDPEEFAWICDYSTTDDTVELVVELLVRVHGRTREQAQERAIATLTSGRLEFLAKPVLAGMIQQCRNEIGLVCFGTSSQNSILWERYGGNGAGVCIELEAPTDLSERQLFRVQYSTSKKIHIDQLIRAFLDTNYVREVYSLALLSKPLFWSPEAEIRFISKRQGVSVHVDGSQVTCLVVGNALTPSVMQRIERIATSLPYELPIHAYAA
jgi:hypothetical protein